MLGAIGGFDARLSATEAGSVDISRDGEPAFRVVPIRRFRGDFGIVASVRDVELGTWTWVDGQGSAVRTGGRRGERGEWAWILDLALEAGMVLDEPGGGGQRP